MITLKAFYTTFIEKRFGHESVSFECAQLVHSLVHTLGISYPLTLRKMNCDAVRTLGWYNAFAYGRHIFINEPFLMQLTRQEQTFLLGHELTHVKENHVPIFFATHCSLLVTVIVVYTYLHRTKVRAWSKRVLVAIGLLIAASSLYASVRRYYESEADRNAVISLNCVEGGISFLQSMEKKMPESQSTIQQLFSTHPSYKQRIEDLRKIANLKEPS
jgi:Zn-dependent protease with chaperone function